MLNDHKINRISLFFSIIIHVGLVIFSLIMLSNPIEISHDLPPSPIEICQSLPQLQDYLLLLYP